MVKAHKIKKVTAENAEQKGHLAENLADTYLRLINTIDVYFQDPITRDETLNGYYLTLSKTVRQLLSQTLIPELKAYYNPFGVTHNANGDKVEEIKSLKKVIPGIETPYYEPFSSLLVASYEMQLKQTNITNVLKELDFFYEAKIRTTLPPSNKSHNTPDNIKKLDGYLRHARMNKIKIVKDILAKKPEFINQVGSSQKIRLNTKTIKFDEKISSIMVGTQEIILPSYKNEYYLCKVMFENKPKEPISWDIIYDRMTEVSRINGGKKPDDIRANWQKVNDTMKHVNNRIKNNIGTDDNLFSWNEKNVIRKY